MPWIYNPTSIVQSVKAFDGSPLFFPSRKRTYVKPEQMSAYVWNLIRERKLANRGGDPKPNVAPKPRPVIAQVKKAAAKPNPKPKSVAPARSVDLVTSSSHHQSHDKVQTESSGKRSASKKLKADKKQPDSLKKVDTQGNSKTKTKADAKEKPKKSRKRTFKRKD
jgi:hypothetical protein